MTSAILALALAASSNVRVVSYNILAGDRGLDGLVETMKATRADLIGLQEVDKGVRRSRKVDQPVALGKALGMRPAFAPHFDFQGGEYGVALLSRWPIVKSERVKVEGSRLSLLDAIVKAPFGELRVVVVHFSTAFAAKTDEEVAEKTRQRKLEAEAALALIVDEKRPALIIGDMNNVEGSDTYQVFSGALQDSCKLKGGAPNTFSSDHPIRRIDYVWASSAFDVKSCETPQSVASDHLPLLVELSPRK